MPQTQLQRASWVNFKHCNYIWQWVRITKIESSLCIFANQVNLVSEEFFVRIFNVMVSIESPVWGIPKIIIFCSSNFTVASPPSTPRGELYCILLCRLSISYKNRCSDVTHACALRCQLSAPVHIYQPIHFPAIEQSWIWSWQQFSHFVSWLLDSRL